MKEELVIEKKVFNKNGEDIVYYDMYILLNGQKIRVQFKDEDKKLAMYLLNDKFGD